MAYKQHFRSECICLATVPLTQHLTTHNETNKRTILSLSVCLFISILKELGPVWTIPTEARKMLGFIIQFCFFNTESEGERKNEKKIAIEG